MCDAQILSNNHDSILMCPCPGIKNTGFASITLNSPYSGNLRSLTHSQFSIPVVAATEPDSKTLHYKNMHIVI